MKLEARFEIEPRRVAYFVDQMEQRAHQPAEIAIETTRPDAAFCWVSGPAQQVMFLIGELAAQGEDALTSVN